jgi:uncharacterized protein (DUF2267 family)
MRTTKRIVQATVIAAGAIGMVAAAAPDTRLGRGARRLAKRLARDVRYAVGSAPGVLYRLSGSHPDPFVSDDILADRIRSTLGPLEKRLDVPHIHVMVEDHIAILHGDVGDDCDASKLEYATLRVQGVDGVESHLHIGLVPGDTRPSVGARAPRPPSPALEELLGAARAAGAGTHDRAAVHAVLCAFLDRIPTDERLQVLAHLPDDARALAGPPRYLGEKAPRLRTIPELVVAASDYGGLDQAAAESITRAVVCALRRVVPEEAADVAAVLPSELRELWEREPTR